jgi:hypothetical protein
VKKILVYDFILNESSVMTSPQGSSFSTGLEVSDKRRRVNIISTGSKSVDLILGGEDILSSSGYPYSWSGRRYSIPVHL